MDPQGPFHGEQTPTSTDVGNPSLSGGTSEQSIEQPKMGRRQDEKYYRILIESLPQPVFLKDRNSAFLCVNTAFAADFGLKPEEFVGKTDFDLFSKELAEKYCADDRRIMAEKHRETLEEVNVVGGRSRIVEVIKAPVTDNDGQVIGLLGIFTDITERKFAEEQLHLLQTMTLAISEASDLHSALQVVLQKVCEATGWIYGQAWIPHEDGLSLQCCRSWFSAREGFDKFQKAAESRTFLRDAGFPGQVWSKRRPLWIPDVTQDPNFDHRPEVHEAGLKTAIGIPIVGGGNEAVAVLEFFALEPREEDEQLVSLVSVVANQVGAVMQRKRAEADLAKERDLLRTLLDNIPDRIYFKDIQSRFLRGSKALLQRLGLTDPEQILGKTDFDFHPPDRAEEFHRDEQKILETGVPLINKVEMQTAGDGSQIWASVSKVPILNAERKVVGLIGVSRDITEVKRTEREMKRVQTFLNSVIENLPITVFIKNARDLRFILWNKAGEELTGYASEQYIGNTDYDFFPRAEAEFYTMKDREALAGGKLVDIPEEVMQTRHKGTRILHTRKIPILNEHGIPIYLLGICEDITERKLAEEKLRTFAARLEQNNRELQDFAYVASHDLQEPLRKVRAFGDRLKTKCQIALGEEGRDYLDRMQNAAKRMQGLIDDLLAFSRITSKAQPFVSVDLGAVVREVLSDLEVRVEQVQGRVEVAELPTIEADPTQMQQLFQNLIGNALKFHLPDKPPVVKVFGKYLGEERQQGQRAPLSRLYQISVQDNGIGFDAKYLDRIFTVFQRLHGRSEYEGTGVGLAICRKIAVRHGGDITAESKPGEGATFIVTLPVQQPQGETIK